MRNIRTEGIVIKRRNYGEADRILTVLTKDHGKIAIKASGVRKITSRRSSHIELLNHAVLNLYKANAFPVLTEAKMIEDFSPIKNDFEKVGLAYHLCELIDGLCPDNQENSRVFFLLRNFLTQLAQGDDVLEQTEVESAPSSYSYLQAEMDDYTLGTFGIGLRDAQSPAPTYHVQKYLSSTLQQFEMELLKELGYWDEKDDLTKNFDTHDMIENILERKLKSRKIFAKLQ
jgi:recombinational DNA repair protein (RecF pathway)